MRSDSCQIESYQFTYLKLFENKGRYSVYVRRLDSEDSEEVLIKSSEVTKFFDNEDFNLGNINPKEEISNIPSNISDKIENEKSNYNS